jgi:hypothetical protein
MEVPKVHADIPIRRAAALRGGAQRAFDGSAKNLRRFGDANATNAPAPDIPGRDRIIMSGKSSTGAGEAIRTPDPNLGKVVLYP